MFDEKILKEQFSKVLSVKMEHDPLLGKTLEVVVDYRSLDEVNKLGKEISAFLETQKWFTDDINLVVLSKGTDLKISMEMLDQYIDKYIEVKTQKSFEGQNNFVIKLTEVQLDHIVGKWNKKGQIRTIKLDLSNINEIEEYIKF
ncbi:hypothetical protein U5U50_00930 [Mycoplasma sp. 888]|uniref:hypothetical protein n=1 Tax=Mycoplasma sp. 888 TaxID=3108483 RepID=UPI002D775640|nr:hypothetical protein [Mycoplasma sp. 888]WRQ25950.1 hypothetical protein U5U50_00930 [Mycoplasma sp. 888]